MSTPEIVYSSQSEVLHLRAQIGQIWRELPASLHLGWVMTRRSLKAEYTKSFAGYFWMVLTPLVYALVFVFLKSTLKHCNLPISTGESHPALFAFVGVMLYQHWIETLLHVMHLPRQHKNLITVMKIAPETLLFSAILLAGMRLLIRLGIILLLAIPFGINWGASLALFPVFAAALILSAVAIGYVLCPLNTIYSDYRTTVQTLSIGIMLASPVFYEAHQEGAMGAVNLFNPVASLLSTARDALLGGNFYWMEAALWWTLVSVVIIALMSVVMRITYPILTEKVI